MASVMVRRVRDRSEIRRFADAPVGFYRGDPSCEPFVPAERGGEVRRLKGMDGASLFLAWRGTEVVGRVCAWVDARLGGCFGWLAAAQEDCNEIVDALLAAAAEAEADDGCDAMVGPFQWPIADAPGLLCERFDAPVVWGTAWNPPWLADAITRGSVSCQLRSYVMHENGDPAPDSATVRIGDALATADHLAGSARTDGERAHIVRQVRGFADAELAVVRDGGAAVAVPDANELLHRLGGDLGWRGIRDFVGAARRKDWRRGRVIASGGTTVTGEADAILSVARLEATTLGPWAVDDERRNAVVRELGATVDRSWLLYRVATS